MTFHSRHETPVACNYGGNAPNFKNSKQGLTAMISHLHVDWLSVTFPLDRDKNAEKLQDFQWWRNLAGWQYTLDHSAWSVGKPMFGYTHAYKSAYGTIAMFGNASMGLHVIYSGQALQSLAKDAATTEGILQNANSKHGKCTRIDVAVDIWNGESSVSEFHVALQHGKCITNSKSWRLLQGSEGGFTLYIGSRSSERMVRVYDKKAERAAAFEKDIATSWIRVETEFKGDRAKNLMLACADNDLDNVIRSHLIDAVDFPTIKDYQLATRESEATIEPTPTTRKTTKTRHWLLTVVAPVIAKEAVTDGQFYAQLLTEINAQIEALLGKKPD